MAASATLALKAGACFRRTRLVMVAPDLRHPRRSQAEIPLIDLSAFRQPPLAASDPRPDTTISAARRCPHQQKGPASLSAAGSRSLPRGEPPRLDSAYPLPARS